MISWYTKMKEENARKSQWLIDAKRIDELKVKLQALGEIPEDKNAFSFAVDFFNAISSFQDTGIISSAPAELMEAQRELNQIIENTGRHEYGINRTKPGQEVTLDNTFWGNICGIWTYSSRDWLRNENVYDGFKSRWLRKADVYPEDPLDRKVIIDFQLRPFIGKNLKRLLVICEEMTA